MRTIEKIVTIIVTFLIFIGDLVITFTKALIQFLPLPFKRAHAFLLTHIARAKKRKKKRHKTSMFTLAKKLKYFSVGVLFSLLFIILPLGFIALLSTLPNPKLLASQNVAQTTKIYDRHHVLLYQFYANQNRTVVQLTDIPRSLQQATIAIEDKNFYQNPGFDVVAIIRAAIKDIKGHSLQGGSTITQQLIKTSLLTSDQTIKRKLEEVMLSFWAEHVYSKNQILQMYLNRVAYGGTAWGVEAASETYFGTHVKDVDLAQAAFLAGLPQAPSTYSPFGENPTLWKARQKEVLGKMQQLGYITKKQEQQALAERLTFKSPKTPIEAPHFVMYIKDLLVKKYGLAMVEKGGLSVTTTLDLQVQNMAQKIVSDEVAKDGYLNLTNGAALITNPQNGDILAMVGSHDYNDPTGGAVNLTTSLRQPGSSIKIVTYSAALAHGYTAASMIDDSPVTYTSPWGSVYSPVNYDGRWHGPVTLRIALANSLNIPAVKTLDSIGIPTFVTLGRQMGISSLEDASHYGLSVTLGSADVTMLNMATAYGTVANAGKRVDLNPILLVKDAKGAVLEQKSYPEGTQVLDPGVTFVISNILADNNARSMEFGPNSPLLIPDKTVSVKTGTTNDIRDNWTIGYNEPKSPQQYVVTVWVGNNNNSPMNQGLVSGITGAAPIWHDIMMELLKGQKDTPLIPPSDIVEKPCFGHDEYFVKGTDQNVFCGFAAIPTISLPQPSPVVRIETSGKKNQIHIRL